MSFWYYLAALFSVAFLIVVHEAGHYFVARWCGMRIERFSIGFGPGIFKRRAKDPATGERTGTIFQIAPIPFGGFVEIRGMNIAEEVDPEDRFAYPNRPAWQRFITIFAGPATNYISAIVLAFGLYTCHGQDSKWHWYGVAAIKDGYDAAGKLEVGDRIVAVDSVPILAKGEYQPPHGDGIRAGLTLTERVTAKQGAPLTLTVIRDGMPVDVTIQPKPSTDKDGKPIYLLGIVPTEQADLIEQGVFSSVAGALVYPIDETKTIATGLWEVVTGQQPADTGGPKRIFEEFAKAWRLGLVTGVRLLMVLSVYLGLFNLFPLPALDGGRLVFLGYEMVTRRRANPKIEAMVHMGGIMVLGVVMVLVTLHDFHLF
jgi:regulator of sigma E protease